MIPSSRNVKIIQLLATLFLAGILGGLVLVYIYYGMNYAKQNQPQTNPVIEVTEVTPSEVSEIERRMVILEDLAKQSSSTLTQTERTDILNDLVNQSDASTVSADERMKILADLQSENQAQLSE